MSATVKGTNISLASRLEFKSDRGGIVVNLRDDDVGLRAVVDTHIHGRCLKLDGGIPEGDAEGARRQTGKINRS